MPLDASDPRPRNPFGQFASGTSVTPGQINKAYGVRQRVLASLVRSRTPMNQIPPLSPKDLGRLANLSARSRQIAELARGDLAIPELARNGVFGGAIKPSDFRHAGVDVVAAARTQAAPGSAQQRIRAILAAGIICNRKLAKLPAGSRQLTAYAARLDRLVALAAAVAPVSGEQVKHPRFVEEDGMMKIVQPDGTASDIGSAPGFANRLRRNKGKLAVAGGLAGLAGGARAYMKGRGVLGSSTSMKDTLRMGHYANMDDAANLLRKVGKGVRRVVAPAYQPTAK